MKKNAKNKKIKIAAIKFVGLASGGTEKAIQTVVANLPKDQFEVDYFYCGAVPYYGSDYKVPDTDPYRKAYMESKGINLIKFDLMFKDVTKPTHPWIETNFWEKFNESDYDIIFSARAGHAEYPFTEINEKPLVDLVTLPGLAERKSNSVKVVHISEFQANSWVQAGGDPGKIEIIPLFDELKPKSNKNLREQLGLAADAFVYGMHQRADDGIYSPVPLAAYQQIQDDKTAFVLLGGSKKYSQQASELNLKNFTQLDHTGDGDVIDKFLNTLNVYSHGRSDGETFSLAIAEAMYHGLPIVSHAAQAMGHVETIGNAGFVAHSMEQYIDLMRQLKNDKELYAKFSANAMRKFNQDLSLESNMKKWVKIFSSIMKKKEEEKLSDEDFWNSQW